MAMKLQKKGVAIMFIDNFVLQGHQIHTYGNQSQSKYYGQQLSLMHL